MADQYRPLKAIIHSVAAQQVLAAENSNNPSILYATKHPQGKARSRRQMGVKASQSSEYH
jgi:hypothetical protein